MCDEDRSPNRDRMEVLLAAGLGKAKLVFPSKKADHNEVQLFLEEKFPKLKAAGGFEILRASGGGEGQRPLTLVPPSREGYTVPPGGGGGTRVYFGWVCAARVSKFGPRFRKNLHSK